MTEYSDRLAEQYRSGNTAVDELVNKYSNLTYEPYTEQEMLGYIYSGEVFQDYQPESPFEIYQPEGMGPSATEMERRFARDIQSFLNPRDWALGFTAIAGSVAHTLTGQAPEQPEAPPRNLMESFQQAYAAAPALPELWEEIKRPYTSYENLVEYGQEHPGFLALDAVIVGSIGKQLITGGLRALQGATTAGLRTSGVRSGMARSFAETAGRLPAGHQMRLAAEGVRTGAVRAFAQAPLLETGNVLEVIQRAPYQRHTSALIDYWVGEGTLMADEYMTRLTGAAPQISREGVLGTLTGSIKGLHPDDVQRLNYEFTALRQLGYFDEALNISISEGRVLPETQRLLRAWEDITRARDEVLIPRLIGADEASQRAIMPASRLGLATNLETRQLTTASFRTQMAEYHNGVRQTILGFTETAEMRPLPERPTNPLALRRDLQLAAEQPELFAYDAGGRFVSPGYYPHYLAEDLVRATGASLAQDAMRFIRSGEMKASTGQLFAEQLYRTDVVDVLQTNIRRMSKVWGTWEYVQNVIDDYALKSWQPGRAVPKGYRTVYPHGFRLWLTEEAGFEKQVMDLARELRGRNLSKMTAAEIANFDTQMIDTLTGKTQLSVNRGTPVLLPEQVLNHVKNHVAPMNPMVEILTDIGGTKSFWRNFVLSLRPAWQAVNETTNALLTGIAGNLGEVRAQQELTRRGRYTLGGGRFPGVIAADTVVPEFGEYFGKSAQAQSALGRTSAGRSLLAFDNFLNDNRFGDLARQSMRYNQARDAYYKQLNLLGEMRNEFRRAGRAGQPMDIGTRVLMPEEVTQVARVSERFVDVVEEILKGRRTQGHNAFLQDMVGRASDVVYSWNKLAPWQRKLMAQWIPFSGWQLFTTGLLFRLPVKTPGRAFILRQLGEIGRDYADDLWRNVGVDPATIDDWQKNTYLPLFLDDDDKVLTFNANSFRLYDQLGWQDLGRTIMFSNPDIKLATEGLLAMETFPVPGDPFSAPPEMRAETERPRRNVFDMLMERFFGSAYTAGRKLLHPYAQYDVGGLLDPEPIIRETGERIPIDPIRETLPQYFIGAKLSTIDSWEAMESHHFDHRRNVDLIEDSMQRLAIDDEGQALGEIRSQLELYLGNAYHLLDQIDYMVGKASSSDRENLQRNYTKYINLISRYESVLRYMTAYPESRVPVEMFHGEGWTSPQPRSEQ